ncbi:prepilin-type N-terminal cleavage/methylation domain-containing protein [Thioalkalivibrio sp. HK1]|uniref:prepilin-type N-terminal cleavage/methylation domain-containing protein n=1 Tax=Thioalkalivibrio sp. HK1 TaxID=1469245 RepID=UPI00047007F4|nr:prepilin-type N-terminal cleavage/methylation domain-containing protein [Thioalkalivibrio sp. HK1]
MRKTRSRGFTIVEIAIVLVVVGLLLGAVMKGQELIGSARVRNIIDSVSGIEAAYFGFVDRYRRVPGDWGMKEASVAIGVTLNGGGDNDGRIDNESSDKWKEPNALWEQLAKAGFLQGEFKGGTAEPNATNRLAPLNPYNRIMVIGSTDDYLAGGTATVRLNLVLGRGMPVDIAREVDVKLDDGAPDTGSVRLAVSTGATFGEPAQSERNCVADGADGAKIYAVSSDSQDCNLVYLF